MEQIVALVAMAAILFLVARGTPGRNLLLVVAAVLALVVVIVALEQNGLWPAAWKTR